MIPDVVNVHRFNILKKITKGIPRFVIRRHTVTKALKNDTGDSFVPPRKLSSSCGFGRYCMLASTTLVNIHEGVAIREYLGYDKNPDIAEKVDNVCILDRKRLGNNTHVCNPSRMFFTGSTENCDGHVDIFDFNTNSFYTV